jgi:hypothetical protein
MLFIQFWAIYDRCVAHSLKQDLLPFRFRDPIKTIVVGIPIDPRQVGRVDCHLIEVDAYHDRTSVR